MSVNHTRAAIRALYIVADDIIVGFANIMDRAKIGRKVMLYSTLWLTWESYRFAVGYVVSHPDKPGIEVAAIVGAVLLPISYLQKAVFDSYLSSTQSLNDDAPAPPDLTVTRRTKSLSETTETKEKPA